jgi:hypothetical protein
VPQDESAAPQARSERVSPQVSQSQEPLRRLEEPQPQGPPGAKQPALPFQPLSAAPQVSQASVAQPQGL